MRLDGEKPDTYLHVWATEETATKNSLIFWTEEPNRDTVVQIPIHQVEVLYEQLSKWLGKK